ncbi:MAG: hypothetical protein IPK85_25225 [Gemmatimonadetes bacterium]|nr:hypothetical protein [Gemmatimonadota bacterium]
MRTLSHLLDLITSDPLTLTATGVLAVAVVGLLLVISWPSTDVPANPTSRAARSAAARSLAAEGHAPIDIARRTGLSRDGLSLLLNGRTQGARQMPPTSAGTSFLSRWRARRSSASHGPQVVA